MHADSPAPSAPVYPVKPGVGAPPVYGTSCEPLAGQPQGMRQITAGGRTFHGYVKSVEEEDEKKRVVTTYVEVMPDGTERELVVKEKKGKSDEDELAEAGFWSLCLLCFCCH